MKFLTTLISLVLTLSTFAQNAYDFRVQLFNNPPTGLSTQLLPVPPSAANGLFFLQGAASGFPTAKIVTFTGLTYNSGTNNLSVNFPTNVSTFTNDSNYVTSSDLASQLSGYVTSGGLTTTLGGFVSNSALTTALAGKISNSDIGVTVQGYSSALNTFSTNGSTYYLNRANHTGTQLVNTISNFNSGVDARISATLPVTYTSGVIAINNATSTTNGAMSASDKAKLDAMPSISGRVFLPNTTFANTTTAQQLSSSKDAFVSYVYPGTVTISLLAGQSVSAYLKYADDSSMSINVRTVAYDVVANSGVLNLTQTQGLRVSGYVPAGKWRQVTFQTTGSGTATPTFLGSNQEILEQ